MDKTKPLELEWEDLMSIDNLKESDNDNCGIYIWGFYPKPNFIPYYVGKYQGNIPWRIAQHITYLAGGLYLIQSQSSLKDPSKFECRRTKTKKCSNPDHIYHRSSPEEVRKFMFKRNKGELKKGLDEMINNLHFTYACKDKWTNKQLEKDCLSDLEKIVISKIGKINLFNKRGGKPSNIKEINLPDCIVNINGN